MHSEPKDWCVEKNNNIYIDTSLCQLWQGLWLKFGIPAVFVKWINLQNGQWATKQEGNTQSIHKQKAFCLQYLWKSQYENSCSLLFLTTWNKRKECLLDSCSCLYYDCSLAVYLNSWSASGCFPQSLFSLIISWRSFPPFDLLTVWEKYKWWCLVWLFVS
jgi:hypothetical protein